MSVQAKALADAAARVRLSWAVPPKKALEGKSLLEVGLLAVLSRHLTVAQAEKTAAALRSGFPDWNELRVSQIQEFSGLVKSKSQPTSRSVARDVKDYLQEIFQKNHGFDLEGLRSDPNEAAKFLTQLPFLGASAAHLIIYAVDPTVVPLSGGIVRVLDRLGLMKRTSSLRKAQATLEKAVPAGDRIEFGARLGLVVEKWCDSKKPSCWDCALLEGCPFGARVFKDWQAQQKRLEIARQREEARRLKEEEKARKRAEAEEKKRRLVAEREEAKLRREEERRRAVQEKKERALAEKKAKEEARKKAVLAKKAAAKKAALAKKVAAKKAAAKKAAAKKAAAKKAAAKKAAAKKVAAKKAAAKKAAAKKAATKKKAAKPAPKKAPARKKATKKVAAKKKAAKKPATRKKPATKKKTTQGSASGARKKKTKKAAARKAPARKPAPKAPARGKRVAAPSSGQARKRGAKKR